MAYSRYEASQTLPENLHAYFKSGLAEKVNGKTVAIKMHVGDGVNYSTIPPVFVRKLVDFIKSNKETVLLQTIMFTDGILKGAVIPKATWVALFWITAVTSASITILKKLISNPSNMLILQGLSMMLI